MADQRRHLMRASTAVRGIRAVVKHPIALAIDVLTVMLYLWEAAIIRPSDTITVAATVIVLMPVIATAFLPRVAWLSFQVLSIASALCPPIFEGLPSTHFSLLFALGLIAYRYSTRTAIGVLSGSIAVQFLTAVLPALHGSLLRNMPSFIAMYALSTLLGCSLRWREELFALRLGEQRIRQHNILLQRNARLAQRIHDSVTGELSFIARLAQQQLRSSDTAEWRQVNDSARKALQQVKQVIDTLDRTEQRNRQEPAHDDFVDRIRLTLQRGDQSTHAVNIHGQAVVHVIGDCRPSPQHQQLILDVLHEVYANILRHVSSGSGYELSVLLDSDAVQLTQFNPLSGQDAGNGMPHSGHGLAGLRKRIEHAGGRLITRPENGDWTFYAAIPLPDSPALYRHG